jgi:hypothetical protein
MAAPFYVNYRELFDGAMALGNAMTATLLYSLAEGTAFRCA